MKPYIKISIKTKSKTIGWDTGEAFIGSLGANNGLLIPEQISHDVDRFADSCIGVDVNEGIWASKGTMSVNGSLSDFYQDFAWRRKKAVKCSGNVVHTSLNRLGQVVPGSVRLKSSYSEKIDWYCIFKSWCEIFPPQLGMLHLFSEPELGPNEKYNSFQIGSFNSALKPDVPNIGWAMFYGDEFSREVNADEISAAGFPIEHIGDGYLIRVTDNINDVVSSFLEFSNRRSELKGFFREDFFLDRE